MLKKLIGFTLFIVLAAGLILGAVNRTLAKDVNHEGNLQAERLESSPQGNGSGAGKQGARSGNGSQGGYYRQPQVGENPQAEVESWISVEGIVTSADDSLATISLAHGGALEIEGRAWSYVLENGFSMQIGDQLRLTGFYEDSLLEVGAIENLTRGTSIQIREQSGRPLWAGRSRQG